MRSDAHAAGTVEDGVMYTALAAAAAAAVALGNQHYTTHTRTKAIHTDSNCSITVTGRGRPRRPPEEPSTKSSAMGHGPTPNGYTTVCCIAAAAASQ